MNDAAWNLLRFSPADHAPQSNFSQPMPAMVANADVRLERLLGEAKVFIFAAHVGSPPTIPRSWQQRPSRGRQGQWQARSRQFAPTLPIGQHLKSGVGRKVKRQSD